MVIVDKHIEVEIRSFLSKDEYERLLGFFKAYDIEGKDDAQVTYYFNGPADLRIQQNAFYSKVWLKKGELDDDSREEIEVKMSRDDFPMLERLF